MVNAILEGRKTQTRRIIKPQPHNPETFGVSPIWGHGNIISNDKKLSRHFCIHAAFSESGKRADKWLPCPYGMRGDRLWVRETWGTGCRPHPSKGWIDGIEYRADEAYLEKHDSLPLYSECGPAGVDLSEIKKGWHPSIFMPRWASRITLEITSVRVERLNEIAEEDALAEGINLLPPMDTDVPLGWPGLFSWRFKKLWESINGKGSWAKNPWIWAITFKRIKP
jgi:hypothetical protein